jgi:hypothetical protein
MKIHQHLNKGNKGSVFDKTSRLTLRSEHDEEMSYLAWLADAVRSGQAHRLYCEEKAKEPGVLQGLTTWELTSAKEVWLAVCSGFPASLSVDDLKKLASKGLVCDLRLLPGRGRYAGRFEYMHTDRLEIVVRAMTILGI